MSRGAKYRAKRTQVVYQDQTLMPMTDKRINELLNEGRGVLEFDARKNLPYFRLFDAPSGFKMQDNIPLVLGLGQTTIKENTMYCPICNTEMWNQNNESKCANPCGYVGPGITRDEINRRYVAAGGGLDNIPLMKNTFHRP